MHASIESQEQAVHRAQHARDQRRNQRMAPVRAAAVCIPDTASPAPNLSQSSPHKHLLAGTSQFARRILDMLDVTR